MLEHKSFPLKNSSVEVKLDCVLQENSVPGVDFYDGTVRPYFRGFFVPFEKQTVEQKTSILMKITQKWSKKPRFWQNLRKEQQKLTQVKGK